MEELFNRLTEKSTWIGVVSIIGSIFGFVFVPEFLEYVLMAAVGISGIALFLLKEKSVFDEKN